VLLGMVSTVPPHDLILRSRRGAGLMSLVSLVLCMSYPLM